MCAIACKGGGRRNDGGEQQSNGQNLLHFIPPELMRRDATREGISVHSRRTTGALLPVEKNGWRTTGFDGARTFTMPSQ